MGMSHKEIHFGDHHYPFHWGIDCTDEIVDRILAVDVDRYVLVVDSLVEELHAGPLITALETKAQVVVIPIAPSERAKSLDHVGAMLEAAFAKGMTRRSCIIAMGGGVVGNIAGLGAALAFRGVRLIHLPTTVIAALDSVLSLKQAVNGRLGKNLVGTFYTPTSVLVDLTWLTTLTLREMRSGLCELIKNALAISPQTTGALSSVLRKDCRMTAFEMLPLVEIAISAKVKVMREDPHEKGEGLALEYGHTIGHALELAAPGLLSHGEAVGVGMLCAAEIAERVYSLSPSDRLAHAELLGQIGVTRAVAHVINPSDVIGLLRYDSKRGYLNPRVDELPMILLDGIGKLRWNGATPLTPVPMAEVERTVRSLGEGYHAHARRATAGPPGTDLHRPEDL